MDASEEALLLRHRWPCLRPLRLFGGLGAMAGSLRSALKLRLRQTVWRMDKRLWCCKQINVGLELRRWLKRAVSGCVVTTVPAYDCKNGLGAAEWAPAKRSWCHGKRFYLVLLILSIEVLSPRTPRVPRRHLRLSCRAQGLAPWLVQGTSRWPSESYS